jgi:hypothetical protein
MQTYTYPSRNTIKKICHVHANYSKKKQKLKKLVNSEQMFI